MSLAREFQFLLVDVARALKGFYIVINGKKVTLSLPTDLLPWELMQENENITENEELKLKKK